LEARPWRTILSLVFEASNFLVLASSSNCQEEFFLEVKRKGHNAAKNFGAYPSFRRRRHYSLERELLGPATVLEFRRVEVAVRIRSHVVENVELTGLIAHSASEITEDLERLTVEDQYPLMAAVNNVQVALLRIW
jgi:hypothetical protein